MMIALVSSLSVLFVLGVLHIKVTQCMKEILNQYLEHTVPSYRSLAERVQMQLIYNSSGVLKFLLSLKQGIIDMIFYHGERKILQVSLQIYFLKDLLRDYKLPLFTTLSAPSFFLIETNSYTLFYLVQVPQLSLSL